MKYYRLIIYVLALTLYVACTKEEVPDMEPTAKMVDVAIVADTDDTRLDVDGNTTYWEAGDRLSVALTDHLSVTTYYTFEIESGDDITADGKHATFRGSVAEGRYSKVAALYPAVVSPMATITLNRHAEDNIFMESTASYTASDYLVINSTSADIPMQFSHLMHKVDYTLTLASGYSGTDISKDVAIEMALRSNDAEVKSVQCYNYDTVNGGLGSVAASAPATLADFSSHNFLASPTATTFIFPAEVENASLVFNVYVGGRKAHTIVKSPSKSPFTMTAGKSTSVSLVLSEDNKCVAETETGTAGIEGVETYLTQIIQNTAPRYGNEFLVTGPDGISFTLCVATNYSSGSHIETGHYEMKSQMFFYNTQKHVLIRSLNNVKGISASMPNGGEGQGYMDVAMSDDGTYSIKLVIAHNSSVAEPLGFIGKLNVENGGQAGGGTTTTELPDIALTTLTSASATDYYTFAGENGAGDMLTFNINATESSPEGIDAGTYEHSSCKLEGYFNTMSAKVAGVSKTVKSGVMHIAHSGSTMVLNADITFSDDTTRHFTFSGAVTKPVVEGDITITASQSSIMNNGNDYTTFTAIQDGNDVTNACTFYANGDVLGGAWFASQSAGSYAIHATKGTKVSNTLTIEVIEYVPSTLTLSASKTTMAADGTDAVTLTVKADNNLDVSTLCEIYVNGSKMSGTTFKTSTAGTHTMYAMYKGVKSNTVTVTANATNKVIVFAEGVTLTSGWYDVNKVGKGDNGDINMCWAASASNILQWWQDRYVADGGTLPPTAVTGPGKNGTYELALMDMFHSEWDNSHGGHVNQCIPWYFEGTLNGGENAAAGSQAVPKTEGGYWKSVWPGIVENMYCDFVSPPTYTPTYTGDYNNYQLWGNGSSLVGTERLKYVSDLVVRAFEHGMASLTISLASNLSSSHHAVTLWGYEIDKATGLLTRVWITDSDDMETEPKSKILHEMSVSIGDGNSHVQFSSPDIRYQNVWLVAIRPVAGPNSAK